MYQATVLADSIFTITGTRLLTVEVTFPRFILAEYNTHRWFSRNSASSRAIPPEIHIERILASPFVPSTFRQRAKGMGQGGPLTPFEVESLQHQWIKSRDQAVKSAEAMIEIGCQKALINRLLEPFMWHTAIISATEWDNFFNLRAPVGDEVQMGDPSKNIPPFPAQPEFQEAAILMRQAMRESTPKELGYGEWHFVMLTPHEEGDLWSDDDRAAITAGRTAKVSFEKQGEYESPNDSIARTHEKLLPPGHMSPTEHAARTFTEGELNTISHVNDLIEENLLEEKITEERAQQMYEHSQFCGNFRHFVQFRKTIPGEADMASWNGERGSWEETFA